ncbi:OmpA family protein [Mariniflexile sp.]|uniref:OmpA family protein n=1 Tax=Mariniflexile sp. TaxID=1979402 RepID=UPI0040487FF5
MRLKNHISISFILAFSNMIFAQSHLQKKADNLFNKFSFVAAAATYQELISNNDNAEYATRKLADSYAYMRDPESAAKYYKKAVAQKNIPIEYYYKYAQALRGIKDYEGSRVWMKKFKENGGDLNANLYLKDADFISAIYGAKPQYFLKNVDFNSKFSDFGAFEHDGKIYFTSSRDEGVAIKHIDGWNQEPYLDVYVKDKSSNNTNVDFKYKVKGDVNSVYHDGPLTITKDGKTMYFSRNDFDKDILGKNEEGTTTLKIYKASLIGNKWTHIEKPSFNDTAYSIAHPALNNNETKLYFTSDMPGGFGCSDIYYVDIHPNGTFGTPQNLGAIVNTDKNESFPFVNSEDALFFSSDGHPGIGMLDIFGSVRDSDKNIVSIINLGIPINSSKDDFSFFMNDDGFSGYLASNRNGGIGSDDIYAFDRMPVLAIDGMVTNMETNQPIQNATVTLWHHDGEKMAEIATDKNGRYQINIDRNSDYLVNIKKEGYIDDFKRVTSKNIDNNITIISTNFALAPTGKETTVAITELSPIYFDFNKASIRQDSTDELDQIAHLMMNVHPKMVIEIQSYTDSRGTSAYNDKLSLNRARSTYKYLLSKGVNPSKIKDYKGYGEQNLTNHCDGTVNCTEAQHQLNRRTQFIVVKME